MSENFTAQDFAQADLATKGEFGVARRTDPRLTHQWHAYGDGQGLFSDDEMAADGWAPVVEGEARDRIMTLLDTKKTHEREIAELLHDMSVAQDEIVDLREESDRLERILQAPLSLKDLQVAWENAEQANGCHAGDVLIIQDDEDNYLVRRMDDGSYLDSTARILSRAPREQWADLADVLTLAEGDIGGLNVDAINVAALLHERGVRVTGGDGDE